MTGTSRGGRGKMLFAVGLSAAACVWWALAGRVPAPRPDPGLKAYLHETMTGHSAPVWQVAFCPGGECLASASVDRTVRLWRLPGGKLERIFTQPEGVTSIAFSPDGHYLASGSYDGTVTVRDLRAGTGRTLAGHTGTVWAIAFSPDGQRLASGGEDRSVRLWRPDEGSPLQTLTGHTRNVWSVAFSPNGLWLASGSFDKTARLWSADTGSPVLKLAGHSQAIVELAFSPDSRWLATASDDASVGMWRVADGTLTRRLTGGSQHVYGVAFSPDGRWLASASRERSALGTLWERIAGERLSGTGGATVRLWQVENGALQQAIAEHSADVHSVAFSPDGRWLASSGDDTTIRLWRLETR